MKVVAITMTVHVEATDVKNAIDHVERLLFADADCRILNIVEPAEDESVTSEELKETYRKIGYED